MRLSRLIPSLPSSISACVIGLVAAFGLPAAMALTGSAAFQVQVSLQRNSSICISETQSAATNATVRVYCGTGQFVSIEPTPGRPFLGVHGGAFRFSFGGGLTGQVPSTAGGTALELIGLGTVTALRVLDVRGQADQLEMLVSF